jgi:hypothetical protein
MATAEMATPSAYPVRLDVSYPEQLSRWLIFVKWLLAIPHFVVLYALALAAAVVQFIAFFAILFTARYPQGMFNFVVGVYRWQYNVSAYVSLLRDEYPPFSMDPAKYPVTYEVDYPERLNRWLVLIKWLLILPNAIVYLLFAIAAYFVLIAAWFAILFTGKYPQSLFDFSVGVMRWGARVNAYTSLMTDKYPPFGLAP